MFLKNKNCGSVRVDHKTIAKSIRHDSKQLYMRITLIYYISLDFQTVKENGNKRKTFFPNISIIIPRVLPMSILFCLFTQSPTMAFCSISFHDSITVILSCSCCCFGCIVERRYALIRVGGGLPQK